MIPKIIHYCWLGDDDYPPLVKKCIKSWLDKMPDWEFRLWDKTCLEFIKIPWVHEAYNAKVYSHAADYIRLYAVYNYGGVYLDSDVEVLKDFTPLTALPYILGLENGTGYVESATFGAEKGNWYIKKCMEWYHDKHFVDIDGSYEYSLVIPKMMKQQIDDYYIIKSVDQFDMKDSRMQLFPVDFFSPKNGFSRAITDMTDNTYSIHHFRNSWFPWRTKLAVFVWRYCGDFIYNSLCSLWIRIRKRR